jgi:biopolymer transport protein ExbD
MAANLNRGADEPISDINVTPFVDIVLVLLIILMVTSVKIVKAAVEIDLPKAATAGESVESTLNIVIEADGDMLLGGEPASDEMLIARVRAEAKKNSNLQAVIAGDKDVAYERVMHAIDLAKNNGVKSIALRFQRMTKD